MQSTVVIDELGSRSGRSFDGRGHLFDARGWLLHMQEFVEKTTLEVEAGEREMGHWSAARFQIYSFVTAAVEAAHRLPPVGGRMWSRRRTFRLRQGSCRGTRPSKRRLPQARLRHWQPRPRPPATGGRQGRPPVALAAHPKAERKPAFAPVAAPMAIGALEPFRCASRCSPGWGRSGGPPAPKREMSQPPSVEAPSHRG